MTFCLNSFLSASSGIAHVRFGMRPVIPAPKVPYAARRAAARLGAELAGSGPCNLLSSHLWEPVS
jgi:hypothetical protein